MQEVLETFKEEINEAISSCLADYFEEFNYLVKALEDDYNALLQSYTI